MTDNLSDQNKRTLRAIILCIMVVFVYTQLFLKPHQQHPQQQQQQAQVTAAPQPPAPGATPGVALTAPPTQVVNSQPLKSGHPTLDQIKAAPLTTVDTGLTKVTISHLGGRVLNYAMTDYKLHVGEETSLDMVDNPSGSGLPLGLYLGNESDDFVLYTLESVNGSPAGQTASLKLEKGAKAQLVFSGKFQDGTVVKKQIEFQEGSYLFDVNVGLPAPRADGQPVWLEWSHYFPAAATNPRLKITHLTYLDGYDKIRHVALADIPEGIRDFGTGKWASVGDLYFMSTVVPRSQTQGRNTLLGKEGEVLFSRVAGAANGGQFTVYVGPKDYKILRHLPFDLERAIDLGWFTFLAYPLLWTIHYLYQVFGNYGLAVIALTLIVKTLMLPLTKASLQSMKKMQEVQPEIAALRERVKDPTQLNQEIFALYKRKGVNPMGGCFPMLIQVPVFLGLYQALLNSIELRHAPFALWITDLSSPEQLMLFGIPIPVMVLLMAGSMLIQTWTSPQPADPAQAKAMMIMPFVFAIMFIVFPMPAGLVLYWLVNNLISITQQVYLRREGSASAYKATFLASLAIFTIGFVLTLL